MHISWSQVVHKSDSVLLAHMCGLIVIRNWSPSKTEKQEAGSCFYIAIGTYVSKFGLKKNGLPIVHTILNKEKYRNIHLG